MRVQNSRFVCYWQPSLRLSVLAALMTTLAVIAVLGSAFTSLLKAGLLLLLSAQLSCQLKQLAQLQQATQRRGICRTAQGWAIWDAQQGWRAVQLRGDSMAIPVLVVLRYRYAGQWFYRTLLVGVDSLSADGHRRLRVRLKFSRQRWRAVK